MVLLASLIGFVIALVLLWFWSSTVIRKRLYTNIHFDPPHPPGEHWDELPGLLIAQFKMAAVEVLPYISLIDETIRVSVKNLLKRQPLTLRARLVGDKGERFESFAHYVADEQGRVCVSSQPSVGGSYTGVEPMGLMWSMKPLPGQRKGIRLMKKDVTKPYIVNLDVFDGHLGLGGEQESVGEPLTSATFEKSYMKAGVRRIPVREGRLRGTLFLPPGYGPFPGTLVQVGHMRIS